MKFFVRLDSQCIAKQVADLVSNFATKRKVGGNRCLKEDGVLHSAKFPAICLATFSAIAGFVATFRASCLAMVLQDKRL